MGILPPPTERMQVELIRYQSGMVGQGRKTDWSDVFFASYGGMIPEIDCRIVGEEGIYPERCVARVGRRVELQRRDTIYRKREHPPTCDERR